MNSAPHKSWLPWIPILAAFPACGFLVGLLTAESNSPAVATVLPLVFGVFGAMGFRALEQRSRCKSPERKLDGSGEGHNGADQSSESSLAVPAAWSIGVVFFCLACWIGLDFGMKVRLPHYKPLGEMVSLSNLTPEEQALLHSVRWKLMAMGVSSEDAQAFFATSILTALNEKDAQIRSATLTQVMENLTIAGTTMRGLASEPRIPASTDRLPG